MKHFVCKKCGNLVATVNFTGKPLGCCKEEMEELTPCATSAARGKHSPQIKVKGNKVTVSVGEEGSAHPQTVEHGIVWICLVTSGGSQRKLLAPHGPAEAHFMLTEGEEVISAFAYCNLHGLWVTECFPNNRKHG